MPSPHHGSARPARSACCNTASRHERSILDTFQISDHSAGMPTANDDSVRRLRAAGLRITTPRLEVLRTLSEGPSHLDADRIAAAVRARTGGISAQTVYNVLASLIAAGLVR